MLMKLLSFILAAVMTLTSIPVTSETALKFTDAVNKTVEWVQGILNETDDAEGSSASDVALPENNTLSSSDTSAEEDFEVSEQAMNDERDPTDGMTISAKINGTYKRTDSWGSVDTEARIDTLFEIDGLHAVSSTSTKTVNLSGGSGHDKSHNFGTVSSGLTGTFYYDLNSKNDVGKNYGVTDFSSLGVYVQNSAPYSESKTVKITPSNSAFAFSPNSLSVPRNSSYAMSYPSFSSSSSATGTTRSVTYTFSVTGSVRDEATVSVAGGTTMVVNYVHVNTFALWNLYVSEANPSSGTSKRASYKNSYTAADASAWNKYEEALVSARKVLCGGVPQTTINAEYEALRTAVLNLKIRCQFKTTGCTNSVAQYYFTVKLFSDIQTQNDRSYVEPTYTYTTITPTNPAGCWLDASKFERTGYAFKQWMRFRSYDSSTTYFDNSGTNAKYTFNVKDTYSTPVVFEPTWEALTYTIHFDENLPTGNGFYGELVGQDTPSITFTWEDQSQVFPGCSWLVHKTLDDGTNMLNYMKFRAWSKVKDSAEGYTNLPGNQIYASAFFNGTKDEVREITLYALWKNNIGAVTLDFNYNGTISDIKDYQNKPLTSRTITKTMVLNTTWALNVNPYKVFYREGYVFNGWHTDPEKPSSCNAATPTDENPEITLYAHWEKKAFYINLDVNSGSITNKYHEWLNNVVDGQEITKIEDRILRVIYGTRFNLPDAACMQRTGYTFYEWELNGVKYAPGAQVAVDDYGANNSSVQLKAIWQKNTTSFILHYNNGQEDVTFSGLYGDPVPDVYAAKFIPDTTGMNDFTATSNSWYTRIENADGTYTYSPYRQTTTFPAESVELYCGWNMKRLTQAVCNDCNRKQGVSDYINVNKDTRTLDFLFLERDLAIYPDGRLYYYTEESRNNLVAAFNVALEYLVDLSPNSTKNLMFDYELKDEIEQAAVVIYDALNKMAFNPADYSRVDAQVARVDQIRQGTFVYDKTEPPTYDCGINTFTAATWRQVEVAVSKIKYNYDTTQQAAVDIFASNIDEAISGLMLKSDVEDWSPLVEVLNIYAQTFTECQGKETITLKGASYELLISKTNSDGTKVFKQAFDQDLLMLADEYFRSARELLTDSVDANTFDLDETIAVLNELIDEILSTESSGDYNAIINLWNTYLSSNTTPYKLELRQQFVNAYKAVDWTLTESQQDQINSYYTTMNTIYQRMTNPSNLDIFEVSVETGTDVATQNTVFTVTYGTPIADLLEVPVRNGYRFAGWFIDENCTMPLDNIVATYDIKVYALWLEDTPRFNVEVYLDGNGAVSVNGGALEFEDIFKTFDKNTNIVLSATPLSGYSFIGWMDLTSGKIISTEATIGTTLVSDYRLSAMFAPVSEDMFIVIFKDKNGVVIDKQEVASGDSALAPDMSYFYYEGYVFDGWDVDFSNVTSDLTVNAVYIRTTDFYKVTVSGGDATANVNLDAVKYNTKITVTVDETAIPDGKVFAGWSIDNGNSIVSYAEIYTFYVVANTNLLAVYADDVSKNATICLSATINGNKLSFVSERSLPDSRYTFIESGILLTTDSEYADKLTLENASTYDAIKHGKTASTSADGQYKVTLNATSNKEYFAVAYLAYVDKYGEIQVIYTDVYGVLA